MKTTHQICVLPGDGIGVEVIEVNDHVAGNPRRTMGECWLEGSGGVMRLDGEARLWWKPHQKDETEHHYDRGRDDTFGGGALQAHFVRHLREGTPLENSGTAYLANMLIQEGSGLCLECRGPPNRDHWFCSRLRGSHVRRQRRFSYQAAIHCCVP